MGSELKHLYAVQDNNWVKLDQNQSDVVDIWKEYYRSTIMVEEKKKKIIDGKYTDGEKNYTKINLEDNNLEDNNSIYIFEDSVIIYTDNNKIEYYVKLKEHLNKFHLTKLFKTDDFKPGNTLPGIPDNNSIYIFEDSVLIYTDNNKIEYYVKLKHLNEFHLTKRFKTDDFKPGDTLPDIPDSNLYVLSNSKTIGEIDKAKALIFLKKLQGGTKKPKPVAKPKKPKPVAKPKKPKPVAKPKKPKPVAKPKKPKPVAKPKKPKPVAKPKKPKPVAKPKKPKPVAKPKNISTKPYIAK